MGLPSTDCETNTYAPSPHLAVRKLSTAGEGSTGQEAIPSATQTDLGEFFCSTLGAWVQYVMP